MALAVTVTGVATEAPFAGAVIVTMPLEVEARAHGEHSSNARTIDFILVHAQRFLRHAAGLAAFVDNDGGCSTPDRAFGMSADGDKSPYHVRRERRWFTAGESPRGSWESVPNEIRQPDCFASFSKSTLRSWRSG